MRVLFIQNNGIQESIGIANLSATLKAGGHETDLLLVSHTPDLIEAITRYDPGLIAFSALTGVHHSLQRLAFFIKAHLNIPIIVGGPHPTYSPDMIDSARRRHHLPRRRRAGDARARRHDGARRRRHHDPQPSREDAERDDSPERPAAARAARRAADAGSRAVLQVPLHPGHADEAVHLEHGLSVPLHVLPRAGHPGHVPQEHEVRLPAAEVGAARGRRDQVHRRSLPAESRALLRRPVLHPQQLQVARGVRGACTRARSAFPSTATSGTTR